MGYLGYSNTFLLIMEFLVNSTKGGILLSIFLSSLRNRALEKSTIVSKLKCEA